MTNGRAGCDFCVMRCFLFTWNEQASRFGQVVLKEYKSGKAN
jgi:hypothetical protein